jgi:hypothetical protein
MRMIRKRSDNLSITYTVMPQTGVAMQSRASDFGAASIQPPTQPAAAIAAAARPARHRHRLPAAAHQLDWNTLQLVWAAAHTPKRRRCATLIIMLIQRPPHGSGSAPVMAALDIHPVLPALTECRYLNSNQLTGTLPEEWSALASLNKL